MNIAIIKIYPAAGYAPAVIDVLESMKAALGAVGGCVGCSVAFETGEDGAIVYTESWESREAQENHLRSAIFSRVLEAMEFSRKRPVVEFFTVTESGGMEVIEMARAGMMAVAAI
jgi:quinol monooxygenase YgiN